MKVLKIKDPISEIFPVNFGIWFSIFNYILTVIKCSAGPFGSTLITKSHYLNFHARFSSLT